MPRLELNRLTLAFKGTTARHENGFLDAYVARSLPQLRWALGLGVILYAVFGILDAIVVPDIKYQLWFVRFVVVCPLLVVVILFSFTAHFKRLMQPTLALLIVVSGLGIIYMIAIGPTPANHTYYSGLILLMMIGYTFVRARFIWATLANWLIVAAYEVTAVWISPIDATILINNNFFCVTANIIGMLVCYLLEYYARRDYMMRLWLEQERRNVTAANLALENKVRQRTAMLEKTNRQLRREIEAHQRLNMKTRGLEDQLRQAQKMEAIGTLAGGIAHDFNNILAAIMGHTELAMMQLAAPEKAKNYLNEVLNASDRAKDLVAQILSFSRQQGSELKPIQISVIVKEALRLLRASLPTTIEIERQIADETSIVVADATQIHQILMNLCTNAAHAMPEGGKLTVTLEPLNVDAEAATDNKVYPRHLLPGAYVCLIVRDTGHGIAAHLQDRIFDPYFTTKEKGVGTGLGLAVVQGIVQRHAGMIWVESTPGKGTSITICLPRIETKVQPALQALDALEKGTERVLFVDDEPILAELGGKLLSALGYKVITETHAEAALSRFRENPEQFDLVITDMVMPQMTGDILARQVMAAHPGLPVIICTGFSEKITPEHARHIGVKGLLMKPITIQQMSRMVRQAIDGTE